MLIRTHGGPFLYGEGVPLELNPSHPWADHVILALPFNRRVLEDVSPYGHLVKFGANGATATNIESFLRPNPLGGFMVHNEGAIPADGRAGVTVAAPHTDWTGDTTRDFFAMCMVGFGGSPSYGAPPWGTTFCKNAGGGSVVWHGPYFSTAGQTFCQFDTGSSANALGSLTLDPSNARPVFFGWGQAPSRNERKYLLRAAAQSSFQAATGIGVAACASTDPWRIGNSKDRDDPLDQGVWNCVVLARYLPDAEWLDWTFEPHQFYRRRTRRRFFDLAATGGAVAPIEAGALALSGQAAQGALGVASQTAALALLGRTVEADLAALVGGGGLTVDGRPLTTGQAMEIAASALALTGQGVSPILAPLVRIAAGILGLTGAQLANPAVVEDLYAIVRTILRAIVRDIP